MKDAIDRGSKVTRIGVAGGRRIVDGRGLVCFVVVVIGGRWSRRPALNWCFESIRGPKASLIVSFELVGRY